MKKLLSMVDSGKLLRRHEPGGNNQAVEFFYENKITDTADTDTLPKNTGI